MKKLYIVQLTILIVLMVEIGLFIGLSYKPLNYNKMIECIPEKLMIESIDDWTFQRLPEEELNKKYGEATNTKVNNVIGITSANEKIIYLDTDNRRAKQCFYHELGHVFDWEHNHISKSDSFQKIYESEKDRANRKYSKITPQEFFADVYSSLITGEDMDTPLAKDFILNIKK